MSAWTTSRKYSGQHIPIPLRSFIPSLTKAFKFGSATANCPRTCCLVSSIIYTVPLYFTGTPHTTAFRPATHGTSTGTFAKPLLSDFPSVDAAGLQNTLQDIAPLAPYWFTGKSKRLRPALDVAMLRQRAMYGNVRNLLSSLFGPF